MKSTFGDYPLIVSRLFEHGRSIHARSEVATFDGSSMVRATFAEVAGRTERLAAALTRLGVRPEDRVGTLCWNHQQHLEAYFAVPGMGAVLHTLNLRLFPDQLAYVINHAEDKVIIVDDSLVEVLAGVAGKLETVEHIVVVGSGDASALGDVMRYEDLLGAEQPGFEWPELDELEPAAMCYTSGTTGNPKGVVYNHRAIYLHSMGVCMGNSLALSERDRILVVVPMFHVNAWGLPFAGWVSGADFVLAQRFVQAEPLSKLIAEEKPTISGGVPTIWNDLLRYGESGDLDLSSLRMIICGGAAVPQSLMERFEERYGVRIIQAWGMTETGPLAALAFPPKDAPEPDEMSWRTKTGRILAGVELRLSDAEGGILPRDGESVGEIEVRGPWVTSAYHKDPSPEKFHDGWLRTGDVGTVDARGYIQITDRAKDVIKSGGEWISSVELENHLMGHPEVAEAAVVAVPDERWDERPLACVVRKDGSAVGVEELREFLSGKVAGWWIPERWVFIDEVPKTSVGKFDKKVLRARHQAGEIGEVANLGQGATGLGQDGRDERS